MLLASAPLPTDDLAISTYSWGSSRLMRRACLFGVVLLVLVLSAILFTPTFANSTDPINVEPATVNIANTVNPVADAHVNAAFPTTNYGTALELRADGSPVKRSYLRFNVAGLAGSVSKAVLRLYAKSSSSNGITVSTVADNTWGETTITYGNAPAVGSALGTSAAIATGTWIAVDVTSYVKGNGTYSFALTNGKATAIALASREAGNKPQLVITTVTAATATPVAPTATKVPPTATKAPATATPVSGSVRVLCDGKVYDGYTTRLFQLDSATDKDPTIQKVIRNCVFRNSSQVPIVIKDAKNVLIEGNTFENIRTHIAGDGVHAINITGPAAGSVTNGITIRNNTFKWIGADGIQMGQNTRYIRNVTIQNNEFVGSADVGENAVDIKGVDGPVYIGGNRMHGFRPCESPKSQPSGNQDCSGSNGPALTIHDGGLTKTSAYNVTVENNDLYDNTIGMIVSTGTRNIVVRGNRVYNNLTVGIDVHDAYSVSMTSNTLSYNPTHIGIVNTPNGSGGSCTVSGNTFVGGQTNMDGGCN